MYAFDFVKPATLDEALAALGEEDAQALGGGQTLIPTLKQRLASPSKLVSLTGIPELKGVRSEGGTIEIGATTTHGAIARELVSSFPALASLAGRIGDPAVRNVGTIGGSIANNDPSACYPCAALACGATIVTNAREMAANAFFQGLFTTALDEGEIVTAIKFPIPEAASYQKFAQPASRFPLTGVFVAKYADGARVAVTGASEDGVFRWSVAEEALGASFTPEAVSSLPIDPSGMIGDIHGTPEYRAHLVKVLTGRAVAAING
jgi:aerobic carbon-monoxide dehydrogenase medium subunit